MPKTKLKIASVSAELNPFSQTGGLADIANSLPKALRKQGNEIIAITPLYREAVDIKKYNLKKIIEDITIIIDDNNKEKVNIWQGFLSDNLPVYFIENEKYFSNCLTRKDIYKSRWENKKFLLFDLAAIKLLIKLNFQADIIHCHDWHTGLIPYFLKQDFKNSETLKNAVTVFTIHNLTFQFGKNWWEIPEDKKDKCKNGLPDFMNEDIEYVNFAKRAILNADIINAVSEQYAKEITTKDFGEDLHRILKNREDKIFGIVNGIDYKDYNPENDPGLYKNFNFRSIHIKEDNKRHIQKFFNLPIEKDTPLFCTASRISEQKGFDLIKDISDIIFHFDLQLIMLGDGDINLISDLKKLEKKYPKKLKYAPFEENKNIETSLYAASDLILIPSRFEPCGLTQMKSMRYGCVPITHHVGGYVDTITNYNARNQTGNGFSFEMYDSRSMVIAISRAIETYKREQEWKKLVKKVMTQSFSWEYPARKYIKLFKKAIKNKREKI